MRILNLFNIKSSVRFDLLKIIFLFLIKINQQTVNIIVDFYRDSHFFHETNITMSWARYKAYSCLNCIVSPRNIMPED